MAIPSCFVLMFAVVLAILSVTATAGTAIADDFKLWKARFNKNYKSQADEENRFKIWTKNKVIVDGVNGNSNSTWTAEMTKYADMEVEEFKKVMLMPNLAKPSYKDLARVSAKVPKSGDVPTTFDWRAKGAVTEVKDQGTVGTCWAFSTAGNIEGQWAINKNQLADLSPEYLVDCDGTADPENSHADCSVFGGWPYLAYQFVIKSGGIPSEVTWPYCSGTGKCYPCMKGPVSLCGPPPYYCDETIEQKCPSAVKSAQISSWEYVSDNEEEMAAYLASKGPLSVLLDATNLQFYKSGVWNGYLPAAPIMKCHANNLDHAVLAVGYGFDDSSQENYWVVKNSWGKNWGEDGYFRIVRGRGMCGLNTQVTSSIL